MSNQRIEAVEPPYSEELQSSFDVVMPPGIPPFNIFRTVGNNPRVLSRMVKGGLLDKGTISIPQRELVILRVCALCNAEYEWGVHVAAFSEKAQFTQEQVADTLSEKINESLWSKEQQSIINMVGELHSQSTVSDSAWAELEAHFNSAQLVELIMLAGLYHAVSFIVNALNIENESFAPTFPASRASET